MKKNLMLIVVTFLLAVSTAFSTTLPKNNISRIQNSNDVSVHFISTGNSDSILIKDGATTMLIDGGDNDDGDTVVNYLRQEGVTNINYMIATHPHADHIGGLDTVLDSISVDTLYVANGESTTRTYKDFIEAAMRQGLQPSVPLENQSFQLYNSSFRVFNTNGGKKTNDQSLVILYTHGSDKFLFTGDAEKQTEKEIISKMVDVDVLKVGHHGSRSSTSEAFFNKVKPEYAIITAGNNNSYGHPHSEVMAILKRNQTEVHRNDECGTVVFTSSGNGVYTNCPVGSYTPGIR